MSKKHKKKKRKLRLVSPVVNVVVGHEDGRFQRFRAGIEVLMFLRGVVAGRKLADGGVAALRVVAEHGSFQGFRAVDHREEPWTDDGQPLEALVVLNTLVLADEARE